MITNSKLVAVEVTSSFTR